ncbi:hypothetical protein LTR66_017720, partial [Elasticomyces elasticus]
MLGTLVALALGRMRNLETFVWDMPTGVLRDVWLALASHGQRYDRPCRLEKVWVRWHDNRDSPPSTTPAGSPPLPQHGNLPQIIPGINSGLFSIPLYPRTAFPTFSILPPLRSINVLDIDEVQYADELSILLEKSLDVVKELRISVAGHAQRDLPFRPVEDRSAVPPPFTATAVQTKPGGLLGVIFAHWIPTDDISAAHECDTDPALSTPQIEQDDTRKPITVKFPHMHSGVEVNPIEQTPTPIAAQVPIYQLDGASDTIPKPSHARVEPHSSSRSHSSAVFTKIGNDYVDDRLRLNLLELERVYLSINSLSRAIDWTQLESLTLLGCMNHEQLWKALRKTFTSSALYRKSPTKVTQGPRPRSSSLIPVVNPSEYKLNLKRIHTDTVTRALLSFIKDTLEPDTLECLFLQETPAYKCIVTVDEIYRSAVRRHRGSLRKLLLNSSIRKQTQHEREREREPEDNNWRKWVCHKDLLSCITSGKMQLRELSIAIDYKDWHYFLQRLPNLPSLRSLHITHIADHPYGRNIDPKEIAMSVLDIISLKPNIELCYLGVEKKCFEILECKANPTQH